MVSRPTRKAQKGFTLVELLVVVLILAILMAVALPLYLGAIRESERRTARANMQTIANANQSYRVRNPQIGYAADMTALLTGGDLTQAISGPGTRTYAFVAAGSNCDHDANTSTADVAVPAGSFGVSTSEATDGCFIPGVSTQ